MLKRANELGHTVPEHYLWCANQHHKFDPTKPASRWDAAWRSLRDAAGLPGFRFHDLRHTVVTDLLEAGEPEHVIEAVTRHLSRAEQGKGGVICGSDIESSRIAVFALKYSFAYNRQLV
jgi:hypothetical protein